MTIPNSMSKRIKEKQQHPVFESPELQAIEIAKSKTIRSNVPDDKSNPSQPWKKSVYVGVLSSVVVSASIAVTIYQSLLLSEEHYYFPFPLMSAVVMNMVQMLLAVVLVAAYGRLFKTLGLLFSAEGWKATYQAILPCSVVTATELAISFMALRFVSVAFYTMVRSSSIIFILFGAFVTGREQVNMTLIFVILLTGAGVVLAAWDPNSTAGLNPLGFGLSLLAAVLGGAKWVLTECLLNENESFMNILKQVNQSTKPDTKPRNLTPLLTCLLLTPLCILTLVIGTVVLEGFPFSFVDFARTVSWDYAFITGGNMLLVAVLIFLIRVSDFRLVQLVSLVTFSFLGIIKEILMIVISVLFLGEVLFVVNWTGLVMTIIGVALYSYYRQTTELRTKQPSDIELTPVTTRKLPHIRSYK